MANVFSNIIPQILERALPTLRENAVMARLVNTDIANVAGQQGDSVNIMVPSPVSTRNVTAGLTGTNVNVTNKKVTVTLDQWKEAPMNLTDKDMEEVMEGYIPKQAQENLKSLINTIDTFIWSSGYKKVYFHAGAAGTTPFASNLSVFKSARVLLNNAGNLGGRGPAPLRDRRMVLNADAEGNALILGNFLKADERGDQGGIIDGQIGRKLGADWYLDQNIGTHAIPGLNKLSSILTKVAYVASNTVITMDRVTLTGTLEKGSLFTLASNSRQFVVNASATAGGNAIVVSFTPSLGAVVASGVAVTMVLAHAVNLHFHRDFYAFASRPLGKSTSFGPLGGFSTIVDPTSGLVVRLEISRQHKQWSLSWDSLYGGTAVLPELACRVLG